MKTEDLAPPPALPEAPPKKALPAYTAPPKKKGTKAWAWILVILVLAGAAYLLKTRAESQQQETSGSKKGKGKGKGAGGPVPVVAVPSKASDLHIYLDGLGTVTAYNTVTIKTRVDGQIMAVHFREGQLVKEGDLLIEIDPRPYQVQLTQAEGQLAKDTATLKNAQVDLERYKNLYAQDAIPKQTLDTQVATVAQDEGIIQADQGAIDNAKLNLVYAKITAPLTGRIGLRLVDPGNIVHASDANGLAVITQLQPIAVLFSIAEDYLPQVQRKLQAGQRLPVDAYDRDMKNKIASGFLLTIDNQIDQTTGTLRFKGEFANRDNMLFPNQFVNARLLLETRHNEVMVPSAAVQRSPQSTYVYVVNQDNTVASRTVVTGPAEGDQISIASGLKAGEVVVVDGVDKLQPGAKVVVRKGGAKPTDQTETE